MQAQNTRAFLLAALFASGGALAGSKVDHVDLAKGDGIHLNDGRIVVTPVNGEYAKVNTPALTYRLKARAGCKGQNGLKQFFVSLGSENVGEQVLEASNNHRQTVPGLNFQKALPWTDVVMQVPADKLGFDPVDMCRQNLQQKVAQGASKMQVMASDHALGKGVWFTAVAACGTLATSDYSFGSKFIGAALEVVCKAGGGPVGAVKPIPAAPPVGGNALQAPFQVTGMSFQATPYETSARCPTRARFSGTLSVSAPGVVKYRVLFPGNVVSSTRTLTFDKAGTRSIGFAEFDAVSSVPSGTATLEVLEPVSRKAHAKFKVNCIAAGGPGGIQMLPGQGAAPAARPVQPLPMPVLPAQPGQPTLRVQP